MVLCWQAGRGIEGLALPERSTTYQFLHGLGLTPLYFILDVTTVAVQDHGVEIHHGGAERVLELHVGRGAHGQVHAEVVGDLGGGEHAVGAEPVGVIRQMVLVADVDDDAGGAIQFAASSLRVNEPVSVTRPV